LLSFAEWDVKLIPYAVFIVVFITHVRSPVTTASDSRWFLPVAASILSHGDPDISEYSERMHEDGYVPLVGVDGGLYNHFPVGTPLMSLPLVFGINAYMNLFKGVSLEEYLRRNPAEGMERLIASFFVAVAAVFVFLFARRFAGAVEEALFAAFVFGFCTSAWSTASRALWQHGPVVLLLSVSVHLLLLAEKREAAVRYLFPVLAMVWIVRPTGLLPGVFLGAAALLKYPRSSLRGILFSLPIPILFMAHNLGAFGSFLPPYYHPMRMSFGAFFPEALAASLFSPNRGLFVNSPILLMAFYGGWLLIRRKRFGLLEAALAASIFTHWIAISAIPHWWGGHSIGPRLFTDMVPFLVYFIVPAAAEVRCAGGIRRGVIVVSLIVLSSVSFFIHFRGSCDPRVLEWNRVPACVDSSPGRVWDWKDVHFLRW